MSDIEYKVVDSGVSVESIFEQINKNTFPYSKPITRNGISVYSLADYDYLLRRIKEQDDILFLNGFEVSRNGIEDNAITVTIRHDIDSDLLAAVELAKIEQKHGISASYYLLHTCFYYGYLQKDLFHRHNNMASIYKSLQAMGHEIGLHIDPYHLYS